MTPEMKSTTALASMLCMLCACSQSASTATSVAAGETQANPCDHAIAAADMSGILTAPATRNAGPDPDTCVYRTRTSADVTISVAKGDTAKGAWMLATTYSGTKVPLAGVGDEALYNPGGTTLIARQGDLSCRVDVVGFDNVYAMDDITKARGEELARKLGALCSKAFAGY